jgi:hypothetical protein
VEVLFFKKELEVEPIQSGKQIPIDKSQIVTERIVAKVGEFDTLAFSFASPLAFHSPPKNLATH